MNYLNEFFELFLVGVLVLCMYFLPACWSRDVWESYFDLTFILIYELNGTRITVV